MGFEEDAFESSPADLNAVSQLVRQVDKVKDEIAGTEALLAQQKATLQRLLAVSLPEALAKAGLPSITSESGRKLSRRQIVAGTWPKDDPVRLAAAVKWLEQENLADNLKCTVKVEFGKGDRAHAIEFFELARGNNHKQKAEFVESVHSSTLGALLRERLKKGKDTPLELFNGHTTWVVEIDEPKQRKI